MATGSEIKRIRSIFKVSAAKLASMIGVDAEKLRKWESRDTDPSLIDRLLIETFFELPISKLHTITEKNEKIMSKLVQFSKSPNDATEIGKPSGIYTTRNKNFIALADGRYIMNTPLVSKKAQAGYLTGWGDEEYIAELPQFPIVVTRPHAGEYVSFEITGDSMNDGSSLSISPGDIVTGRKVDRSHWKDKLHIKKYSEFIIVSIRGGIIVKQIIEHDVENGTITCRSRNPDKNKYPDQIIRLDTIMQLFNVVQVTIKR